MEDNSSASSSSLDLSIIFQHYLNIENHAPSETSNGIIQKCGKYTPRALFEQPIHCRNCSKMFQFQQKEGLKFSTSYEFPSFLSQQSQSVHTKNMYHTSRVYSDESYTCGHTTDLVSKQKIYRQSQTERYNTCPMHAQQKKEKRYRTTCVKVS